MRNAGARSEASTFPKRIGENTERDSFFHGLFFRPDVVFSSNFHTACEPKLGCPLRVRQACDAHVDPSGLRQLDQLIVHIRFPDIRERFTRQGECAE